MLEIYKGALLVSGVVPGFVEPVRLLPAGVKAHGAFVLQQLIDAAGSDGRPGGEALLLGVAHWGDRGRDGEEFDGDKKREAFARPTCERLLFSLPTLLKP